MNRLLVALALPGSRTRIPPGEVERTLTGDETLTSVQTSFGEGIAVVRKPAATGCRSIIFLYGNAMTLADTPEIRATLTSRGNGLACPDYPGFGLSTGNAGEDGCYRAADACLDLLGRAGIRPEEVVVAGWSLGSAVALELASRRAVNRLVLLSPLTGLAAAFLSMAGLGWLGQPSVGPFSGRRRARSVRCPSLLITGGADTLTPPAMARELSENLGGPTEMTVIPWADHLDLLDNDSVWRAVLDFANNKELQ